MYADPKMKYEVTVEDGKVVSVRTNGRQIDIGQSSQEFCDFLSWASRQPKSVVAEYAVPSPTDYFADCSKLVEHCKKCGVMLTANDGYTDDQISFDDTMASVGSASFSLLYRCVVPPPRWHMHMTPSGVIPEDRPRIWVTRSVFDALQQDILDEDSEVRKITAVPVERTFVYLDISDVSQYPPAQQALAVNALGQIVTDEARWDRTFTRASRRLYVLAMDTSLSSGMPCRRRSSLHVLRIKSKRPWLAVRSQLTSTSEWECTAVPL